MKRILCLIIAAAMIVCFGNTTVCQAADKASGEVKYSVCEPVGFADKELVKFWNKYYSNADNYWYDDYYFCIANNKSLGSVLECCDYKGNSLYKFFADFNKSAHIRFFDQDNINVSAIHIQSSDDNTYFFINVYDKKGKKTIDTSIKTSLIKGYPDPADKTRCMNCMLETTDIYGNLIELYYKDDRSQGNNGVIGYLNLTDGSFSEPGTITLPERIYSSSENIVANYDTKKWAYYRKSAVDGLFFAANADRSKWCFVNEAGEVLGSFADASDFTKDGYALVSDDGKTYYLMDSNFKIYKEYAFAGVSASSTMYKGNTLSLTKEDGSKWAIRINPKDLVGKAAISKIGTSNNNPKLSWDKVKGASGYRVFRKTEGDKKYVKVVDTKKLTYTDKKWKAKSGTKISYIVRAYYKSANGTVTWGEASKVKKWTVK